MVAIAGGQPTPGAYGVVLREGRSGERRKGRHELEVQWGLTQQPSRSRAMA